MSNFLEKIGKAKDIAEFFNIFASADANGDFCINIPGESGKPHDSFVKLDADSNGALDVVEVMGASRLFSDPDFKYILKVISAEECHKYHKEIGELVKAGIPRKHIPELYFYFGGSLFGETEAMDYSEGLVWGMLKGLPKYIRQVSISDLLNNLRSIRAVSSTLSKREGIDEATIREILVEGLVKWSIIGEANRDAGFDPKSACKKEAVFLKELIRGFETDDRFYKLILKKTETSIDYRSTYGALSALFLYWGVLKKEGKKSSDAIVAAAVAVGNLDNSALQSFDSMFFKLQGAGFGESAARLIIEWDIPKDKIADRISILSETALANMAPAAKDKNKQKFLRFMLKYFGAYLLNYFNIKFANISSMDELADKIASDVNKIYTHYTGPNDRVWVESRTDDMKNVLAALAVKEPAFAEKLRSGLSPKAKSRLGIE